MVTSAKPKPKPKTGTTAKAVPLLRGRGAGEGVEPVDAAGRAYGGLRLEDRVAARRARFIDAGIELFGTEGFRGATVRGICAAAGLTDRYFYESFASLETLLVEVFRTVMRTFAQRLLDESLRSEAWRGSAADMERQATVGYELWFDTVRDPRFARIVLVEVLGVSATVDAVYEASMREMAELTIAPLEAALPQLKWSRARRAMLGRALVGAALQVAKMWMTGGYRAPRREVVRTCVLVAVGTLGALRTQA